MYINTSTYGGVDWHDSRIICEQLKYKGSYFIEEQMVFEVIAEDVLSRIPHEDNLKDKILCALTEKSCFQLVLKTESTDASGKTVCEECGTYEMDGRTYYEREAAFNGRELTLTVDYLYGQISHTTTYHVEDIPDDQIGYIVTENFPAPVKGIPLVERMYHDIFDQLDEAENYARNLKLHDFRYPHSVVAFLICNKNEMFQTEWYQLQKKAMTLMEEKQQTYLCDSFSIFVTKGKGSAPDVKAGRTYY